MQSLIDKKIADAINETLTKKQIIDGTSGREKKINLLDILNRNLEGYIDEIEKKIKSIESTYDFKMDFRTKQKLTANDLKEQIIYAYISRRNLRKDNKPIKNLSAGERKKALVDVAYSLIFGNTTREKYILFAIDEPESSLHISNCFSQFERIEEIAKSEKCQVLMTTHWYGALPILNNGTLVHLELNTHGQPTFNKFSFRNYFEERGSHPNDVQLKSFYDLTTSIISSIRHYKTNWLIVEGTDDYNYIEKNISFTNTKILPVGGCSIVKLLYDFLFVPLSHKAESKDIKGKIFCLIDTDNEKSMELQHDSQTKSENLVIRRLQLKNNTIELVKEEDYNRLPTEVEDSLHPNDFYRSIQMVATELDDKVILKTLSDFSADSSVGHSMIPGDNSMLIYSGLAKDLKAEKQKIIDFKEDNKQKISLAYRNLSKVTTPNWMKEIEAFFK